MSSSRASSIVLAAAVSVSSLLACRASAQVADASAGGAAAPDIDTSEYTFAGEVNADGTLLRSGPSEQDYATLKVAKGTRLTVVGMRNDWLKVVPPEGSFCLVAQAYVNKRGNDSVGRVETRAPLRIGSALTPAKHKVPEFLEPGTEVQILGESEEMYKVLPPKGVFVYVPKQFVDPVRRLDAGGTPTVTDAKTPPADKPSQNTITGTTGAGDKPEVATTDTPETAKPKVAKSDSPRQPGTPDTGTFTVTGTSADATATTAAPTTQTAAAVDQVKELQEKLAAIEDRYAAASKQEITEQPIDPLLKDYNDLLANAALPSNARRVAEYRVNSLKLRQQTLAQYVATKKAQDEIAAQQKQLQEQQQTLQARVAEQAIKRYAAIGQLTTSSLMANGQPLFRLIDPATKRTIVYIRTAPGQKIGQGLDQFVAVNGTVTKDDAMKITYVVPDSFEAVDIKQVNRKIFAEYAPPSLATANLTSSDVGGQ